MVEFCTLKFLLVVFFVTFVVLVWECGICFNYGILRDGLGPWRGSMIVRDFCWMMFCIASWVCVGLMLF